MTTVSVSGGFYGWRVVGAAFVLGVFGWGLGFYGPPVFLSVIREAHGWPLALISTAVTVHFLVGAVSRRQSAGDPSALRRSGGDQSRRAGDGGGPARLGHRGGAVAALRCRAAERRGLGHDERGGAQCDRLALVRPQAAGRARHGL